MRILIIEDERKIAETISDKLKKEGFAVDIADNGLSGEEYAVINNYDVIILDIMLPKQDGWTTCRKIRENKITVPILMLTALDEVSDKINGLNGGADDYLSKPFHLGELVARIRSLIRRNSIIKSSRIEMYGLVLDLNQHKVFRNGQERILTAKEFALLELFMVNAEKILDRSFISEHIWDMNFDPKSNVIDAYVKFLRQKIDKDFETPLIHTVRGAGYIFSEKGR